MGMRLDRMLVMLAMFLGPLAGTTQTLGDPWAMLAKQDADLRQDVIATEQVVDLVNAWVTDSIIEEQRQRLKGLGGWIIQRAAARYWQQLDDHKQKYVGSNSRPYHIYNGVGDEVDINIFLMPHLPRYVSMVKQGFDEALERNRKIDAFRFDQPDGLPQPAELKYEDRGYLTVECEVTAPQKFADVLNQNFLPVSEGTFGLDTLRNVGSKYATMGLVGPWCMDCNHNCRPEIHPIEWIWWLDLSPGRPGSPNAKSWMVGLIVDASNRFKDWTLSPIAGEIALPFLLPEDANRLEVNIDWIAGDPVSSTDSIWQNGPADAWTFADTTFTTKLDDELDLDTRTAEIQIHGINPQENLRVWTSPITLAPNGKSLIGYLHITAFVTSLAAMRVTIDHQN